MRYAALKELQHPSTIFWMHGDNVLSSRFARRPYTTEELRRVLNYYALFAERLCILDICLLNNANLAKLVMRHGYDSFVSEGVLVPLLRSSVRNFEELELHFVRDPTAYGVLDTALLRPYAQLLDTLNPRALKTEQDFFSPVLSDNLHRAFTDLNLLRACGLNPVREEMTSFVGAYFKRHGQESLRRSAFFFLADEITGRGHPRYGQRIRLLSSAVYNNTFWVPLGLRPAFPHTFLDALLKMTSGSSQLGILEKPSEDLDPFGRIQLSLSDLDALTPPEVLEIRKKPEAREYLAGPPSLADSDAASALHIDHLMAYLGRIQTETALAATGRTKMHRRAARSLAIAKWAAPAGGVLVALGNMSLGLAGPLPGIVAGLAWGFGNAFFVQPRLQRAKLRQEQLANEEWRRIKSTFLSDPVLTVTKGVRPMEVPEL